MFDFAVLVSAIGDIYHENRSDEFFLRSLKIAQIQDGRQCLCNKKKLIAYFYIGLSERRKGKVISIIHMDCIRYNIGSI